LIIGELETCLLEPRLGSEEEEEVVLKADRVLDTLESKSRARNDSLWEETSLNSILAHVLQLLDDEIRLQPSYTRCVERTITTGSPSSTVRFSSSIVSLRGVSLMLVLLLRFNRWTTLKLGSTLSQVTNPPTDPTIKFNRQAPAEEVGIAER